MSDFTFDVALFRQAYPEFASQAQYPDIVLRMYWDTGTNFISDQNYGSLKDAGRNTALNLMTAHLTKLASIANAGSTVGLEQSATIGSVSVSLTPPPLKNQWQWWLSTTPYGQQLFALLQMASVGGFYVGGRPETLAFRKVGGLV